MINEPEKVLEGTPTWSAKFKDGNDLKVTNLIRMDEWLVKI